MFFNSLQLTSKVIKMIVRESNSKNYANTPRKTFDVKLTTNMSTDVT